MKAAIAATVLVATGPRAVGEPSMRTEVIVTDSASDALIASGLWEGLDHATHGAPFILGLVGAAVGAPIEHAARGEWGRAGISLTSRTLLPILGFTVADRICDATHGDRRDMLACIGVAIVGGGVGLLGAEVIDWSALSRGAGGPPSEMAMPAGRFVSFGGHF